MPEAQVQTQTIFNNAHGPSVPGVDLEDDFNADETEDEIISLSDISTSGKGETENATSSVTSITGHDYFSQGWIQSEALNLLNRIRQQCDTSVKGKRIIFAGHGSGGVVVKQVKRTSSCLECRVC